LFGGRGERDREVERELWPERVVRIGMWIERDKRREVMPPDDQEEFAAVLCLRGLVDPSPAWEDPAAELGAIVDEGVEGLSQEMVACLRMRPGLEEDREAAMSPGEEEECVRVGGPRQVPPRDARCRL
jgi:hypothetical protein